MAYFLAAIDTKRLYSINSLDDESASSVRPSFIDDFLRIAQEYETAFGRIDLHRFLQEQTRDDDFTPGDFHERLLRLPWRDVFTTNWDTLLERARRKVVERSYHAVVNMDQIPLANQPRIVELHGSLPAQFSLIFTEENHRTYPTQFALFVNTVQQAMTIDHIKDSPPAPDAKPRKPQTKASAKPDYSGLNMPRQGDFFKQPLPWPSGTTPRVPIKPRGQGNLFEQPLPHPAVAAFEKARPHAPRARRPV